MQCRRFSRWIAVFIVGIPLLSACASPARAETQVNAPKRVEGAGRTAGRIGGPAANPYLLSIGMPTIGPSVWPFIGPMSVASPRDRGSMTARTASLNPSVSRNRYVPRRTPSAAPKSRPVVATVAKAFLPDQPVLGVTFGAGTRIAEVDAHSPAAMAGIRVSDRIVAINRSAVGSPSEVVAALHSHAVSKRPVELVVMRQQTRVRLRAQLLPKTTMPDQSSLAHGGAKTSASSTTLVAAEGSPVKSASRIGVE